MAKKVTTIPATLNRFDSRPIAAAKKRKTAGYARVSTDSEEQATSYEAQVDYYTRYINSGRIGNLPGCIRTKASLQRTQKSAMVLTR